MTDLNENPFLTAIIRQKQEIELLRNEYDVAEDRFDHIFTIKKFKLDNQILSYMAMPFDYEPELEKKEIEANELDIVKLGLITNEQVYILNDLDVQDPGQTVMYDEETGEVWEIRIKVECLIDGSYFDENKKTWILPKGTKEAKFHIYPIKNQKEHFDFSEFHEFSIKSMEKMTNYMMLNDEEGQIKLYLEKEPQDIKANIIQDYWEQVIRVKLITKEGAKKWLTHYICFKTKD